MDVLQSIMAERRADVAEAKTRISSAELRRQAEARTAHRLSERLARTGDRTAIVAEMKQASPSAGRLRVSETYDPAALARAYAEAGAAGLSILTEPRHFGGTAAHLHAARDATALPILRKDFVCDTYQVLEAAAWGADVVLLIVAALDEHELNELAAAADDCGLDILAEAHTREELERALAIDDAIVGVNSRNLKTLTTDLETARELAALIPPNRLSIAESGIRTRADVVSLAARGYNGFLVGETLMRRAQPAEALRELLGE